jgi:hypothetical protein
LSALDASYLDIIFYRKTSMFEIRTVRAVALLAASLVLSSLFDIAQAQSVVIGVNAVNPLRASVADQNALIAQLKTAHVRIIRCGISSDAKGIDFAKRLYAQGIKIQLIVSPAYPPNAPTRPYKPDEFAQMWGGHPLSSADPDAFKGCLPDLVQQSGCQRH